ncbi:conserved hypothetical protein [Thiomonas arsenitoxydans]|uniref:Uncharacterized protein n=2 Tax=Thiomonas arsenitoxydans (strain DSM 22701 / CIP 110005 / 3As) TaxID=426114 RepID=D6CVX5_THIA3|nr:hypothetical protein THI_p0068 [Thiomonas arsenitoxydans]CQR32811.1 conserved hypothetical protein [Thiomonas arsenitoxydans]
MPKALTMRSKITVRWTTNPADMGYDGRPSDWKESGGEVLSIRQASTFAYKLGRKIGEGTNKLIYYTNGGREVSLGEINEVINAWECAARENRRYG